MIWLDTSDLVLYERMMKRGMSGTRADDNSETIKSRLKTYNQAIKPMEEHFNKVGLPIYRIDASKSVDCSDVRDV